MRKHDRWPYNGVYIYYIYIHIFMLSLAIRYDYKDHEILTIANT